MQALSAECKADAKLASNNKGQQQSTAGSSGVGPKPLPKPTSKFYWLEAFNPDTFGPGYQEELSALPSEAAAAASAAGWHPAVEANQAAFKRQHAVGEEQYYSQLDIFLRQVASSYLHQGNRDNFYLKGAAAAVQSLAAMYPPETHALRDKDLCLLFRELPSNRARHVFLHQHIRAAALEEAHAAAQRKLSEKVQLQKGDGTASRAEGQPGGELKQRQAEPEAAQGTVEQLEATVAAAAAKQTELEASQQHWQHEAATAKAAYAYVYHSLQHTQAELAENKKRLALLVNAHEDIALYGKVLNGDAAYLHTPKVRQHKQQVAESLKEQRAAAYAAELATLMAKQIVTSTEEDPQFRQAVAGLSLTELRQHGYPDVLRELLGLPADTLSPKQQQPAAEGSHAGSSGAVTAAAAAPSAAAEASPAAAPSDSQRQRDEEDLLDYEDD